jgi:hypothetical protein
VIDKQSGEITQEHLSEHVVPVPQPSAAKSVSDRARRQLHPIDAKAGDAKRAGELRRQAAQVRREAQMNPVDVSRLKRVEMLPEQIKKINAAVEDGRISQALGEQRIRAMVRNATTQPAATSKPAA